MSEQTTGKINVDDYLTTTSKKYDLELFLELNREYKSKPVVSRPRELTSEYRTNLSRKRARQIQKSIGLRGKRVIEVGCGGGEFSRVLADEYGCKVIGIDIVEYPTWADLKSENVQFMICDLGKKKSWKQLLKIVGGPVDRIVSLVVWEHTKHPYTMLESCYHLLKSGGLFYLRANLYRSAIASHRYREVYFPWPHLLFSDEVFEAFYRKILNDPSAVVRTSWLNKLTYAQYLLYFEQIGFKVKEEFLKDRELDQEFYRRFEEKLSAYPLFDLTLDFFDVALKKPLSERCFTNI
jgi:2-polyprenyl-3-methyl-5-hydroxy-6-metoxy-1,4-benzoquinol methylase